ncbi:MAG: hypothetical protein HQL95_03160 [Magnetococcales bacterium]|nr:hypothetical protein [Magnetococcales bacterium]
MRLALPHGNLIAPEHWTIFKNIRASAFIPALPVLPVKARTATPSGEQATSGVNRFIYWMEKALVVALFSLWALAGLALIDGLRMLFF